MYPMYGPAGNGFLRLHSTYRHDLKIYTSDEGRVQTSAAAFTQGLLDLEGTSLTPILVRYGPLTVTPILVRYGASCCDEEVLLSCLGALGVDFICIPSVKLVVLV